MGSMLESLHISEYTSYDGKKFPNLIVEKIDFSAEYSVDSQHTAGTNKNVVQNNGISRRVFNVRFLFFTDKPSTDDVNMRLNTVWVNIEKNGMYSDLNLSSLINENAYDKCKRFRNMLYSSYYGYFKSPIYTETKPIPVTPTSFKESISFVNGLEMLALDVTFLRFNKTQTNVKPKQTKENVEGGLDKHTQLTQEEAAAEGLIPESRVVQNGVNQAKQKTILENTINKFTGIMDAITSTANGIENNVSSFEKKVNNILDVFITDPLFAFMEIQDLLKLPAKVLTNMSNKINGYMDFVEVILNNDVKTYSEKAMNNFLLSSVASAVSLSTVTGNYLDRNEALYVSLKLLEIKDKILEGYTKLEGTIEANITETYKKDVSYSVNPEIINSLNNIITANIDYLEETIFRLPSQCVKVLDRERNFIELCYEIYGDVDEETLSKFLSDNKLVGYDIYLLPKGGEIVYYQNIKGGNF